MRRSLIVAALMAMLVQTPALAQATAAQVPAASLAGMPVVDTTGRTLGIIEKTLAGADGRVRQVLVRTRKGTTVTIRTLSVSGLQVQGNAMASALSLEEFESLPATPQP